MSGICGVFNRDGNAPDSSIAHCMMAAANYRQAEYGALWCDGPIVLAYQHLNNLPAARCAAQPVRNEFADLSLVLHGRIDNRRELSQLLGLPISGGQLLADTALVLQAYQRWGADCSDRLIGDFAFVIWDGKKRCLFASRDPSGCIPFYYALLEDVCVVASELCQVLAHPAVSRCVNEGMVAEHLSMGVTSKEDTLYQHVQRLPPGHQLEVSAGRSKLRRYWQYLPGRRITYRDPREYMAQFLELFERAVADRLDCTGPPGITLSGGLDSPSVAGMVQSLLNRGERGQRLRCFSLTDTIHPGEYDEGPYIQMVVDKWQLNATRCSLTPVDFPDWRNQVVSSADLPPLPNDALSERLNRAASKAGVTTLFSGAGASGPLGGSPYSYPDLLAAGLLGAAGLEWASQWRDYGPGGAAKNLARSLCWPLMPRSVRGWAERHRHFAYRSPFLSEGFAHRVNLYDRHRADSTHGQIGSLDAWYGWWNNNCGSAVLAKEVSERQDARFGQAGVHPFLDRRLQEYLFSLPSRTRRYAGEGKQLLVRSGLLPAEVARDRVQGDYGMPIRAALCSTAVQRTLQHLVIAELGWVDQGRVNEAARIARESAGRCIWHTALPHLYLWQVFSLELWYQTAIMRE